MRKTIIGIIIGIVVGTWIDGKPIYQRTIDLGENKHILSTSWFNTYADMSSINYLFNAIGVNGTEKIGQSFYLNTYIDNQGKLNLLACRDNDYATVRYVTIQYTKTTDQAS